MRTTRTKRVPIEVLADTHRKAISGGYLAHSIYTHIIQATAPGLTQN